MYDGTGCVVYCRSPAPPFSNASLTFGVTEYVSAEDVRRDSASIAEASHPMDSLDDLEKQEHALISRNTGISNHSNPKTG